MDCSPLGFYFYIVVFIHHFIILQYHSIIFPLFVNMYTWELSVYMETSLEDICIG